MFYRYFRGFTQRIPLIIIAIFHLHLLLLALITKPLSSVSQLTPAEVILLAGIFPANELFSPASRHTVIIGIQYQGNHGIIFQIQYSRESKQPSSDKVPETRFVTHLAHPLMSE